jgi:hypothetical protein
MKPATKITTAILGCALAAGLAFAQNPNIIQNTRNQMNAVSNTTSAASSEALGLRQSAPAPAPAQHIVSKSTSATPRTPMRPHHPRRPIVVVGGIAPAPVAPAPEQKKEVAAEAAPAGDAAAESENGQPGPVDPKYAANGRRDPFLSPVVSHAGGSGCSTGKKCLEIGTINLRGVVHSENGFIAVVSNGLNKAYFLRENDPVFNGYVVKITGDSIVFQETMQDRLGKSFTREVVKKITTPAV